MIELSVQKHNDRSTSIKYVNIKLNWMYKIECPCTAMNDHYTVLKKHIIKWPLNNTNWSIYSPKWSLHSPKWSLQAQNDHYTALNDHYKALNDH